MRTLNELAMRRLAIGDCFLCALGLFLLALSILGCAGPAVVPPGELTTQIPNFRTVEPGLYRGGQPARPSDWTWLRSIGVSNVIVLHTHDEADDRDAVRAGLHLFWYPIDTLQQLVTGPDPDAMRAMLLQVGPGTFIHCQHGWDRTGLAVYLYRLQEGWTPADARREMLALGFHPALHGLDEFAEHWRN